METEDIADFEPSPWQPISAPRLLALVAKAQEELGELASALARSQCQGFGGHEPKTGKLNLNWVEDEVGDVRAVVDLLEYYLPLNVSQIELRRLRKQRYLRTWLDQLSAEGTK